jgi:hypothetical protein
MSLSAIQIARPILDRGSAVIPVIALRSAFVLVVYAVIAVAGALLSFLVALLGWRGLGLFVVGAVLSGFGLLLLSYILHMWNRPPKRIEGVAVNAARDAYMKKVVVVTVFTLGMVVVAPFLLPMVLSFVSLIALLGGGFAGVFFLRVLRVLVIHLSSSAERPSSPSERRITTREP